MTRERALEVGHSVRLDTPTSAQVSVLVQFSCFSSASSQAVERLQDFLAANGFPYRTLIARHLRSCGFRVLVVSPADDPSKWTDQCSPAAQRACSLWLALLDGAVSLSDFYAETSHGFEPVGFLEREPGRNRWRMMSRLPRGKAEGERDLFLAMMTGRERYPLLTINLLFLATLWSVEGDRFPIHAAGVVRDEQLFLFLGPSGAGKSTLAELSRRVGMEVIDDEAVLLERRPMGLMRATSWNLERDARDVELGGIFTLVKGHRAVLQTMRQPAAAKAVFDGVMDLAGMHLPPEAARSVFGFAAETARLAPGYRLEFRLSPDFWEQIP